MKAPNSKSKQAKPVTLRDAVERYLGSSPDLKRARTYCYRVNCWERHASINLPITTANIEKFRASCLEAKLSSTTIEDTISDMLTVLRGTKCKVPDPGRRLRSPRPTAKQPTTADIGKVYGLVSHTIYPRRTFIGPAASYSQKTKREQWKLWTTDERERFWRGLLFLGYWTGLRIGDLRQLEWSHVCVDRIDWQASKTGAPHVFPITPDVQRHLDMLRGLDPVYVTPIPKWSIRFVRRELTRLCNLAGVERFGPQMVRRASISEWSCTTNDAGSLVHGCGLGIRQHYVNPLKVLTRAAVSFELPVEMREQSPAKGSSPQQVGELAEVLKGLSPEEMDSLLRLAKALAKPEGGR
ncbi:MAG: hypothetical protein IAG10_32775 [Planctomycetaceae bacterium]|nr:hypothetical protein [Planctomycetaceae bacterium]